MIVTTEWMSSKYNEFNLKYWDGALPRIDFKTNKSSKTWGFASYRLNVNADRRSYQSITPVCITMSNYYDSDEWIKENVMLHEMIHIADYYFHPEHFLWRGRKVRGYDAHGPNFFLKEARRLSNDGWNIEKYVSQEEKELSRPSDEIQSKIDAKAKNGYVVGFFYLLNGKYGVAKVKPSEVSNYNSLFSSTWKNWFDASFSKVEWRESHDPRLAEIRCCSKNRISIRTLKDDMVDGFLEASPKIISVHSPMKENIKSMIDSIIREEIEKKLGKGDESPLSNIVGLTHASSSKVGDGEWIVNIE